MKYSLIVMFLAFFSCQDDDICIDDLSPKLTIVFLDALGEKQALDSIFIDRVNPDLSRTRINTIDSANVDSLQLEVLITMPAKYILYRSTVSGITDDLSVSYTPKLAFVSKACGFRNTYENLSFSATSNLISSILPNANQIKNEQETHLFITY